MGHANSLFYSSLTDSVSLHSRITPTTRQREFLQENWRAMADSLTARLSYMSGYPIRTWIQGSYKFGTQIKPINIHEEYDVDVGAYFCWADSGEVATPAAKQLKDWVQLAVAEYLDDCEHAKSVVVPPKERCSRLHFKKQFHIDVPAYHLDEDFDRRKLATETKGWEDSDPKAIYAWFKEKVENPERDQLRRLIRYLKAWAAVTFGPNSNARPSSLLLTVLATESFVSQAVAERSVDDEDAFCAVVIHICKRLESNPRVPNPVNAQEELNRLKPEDYDVFWKNYIKLSDAATLAADAEDEAGAALIWSEVFSYLFPLPDTETVEIVDATARGALMIVPNIQIDVVDKKSARHIATYQNEMASVMRDCTLTFTITNPEVVPAYATVEWTVRNEGPEAEQIGDLGHRQSDGRSLSNSEHTAYCGRHHMDCVIKQNGSVLAVRRIAGARQSSGA